MAQRTLKIGLSDADKATMSDSVRSQTLTSLIGEYSTSSTYAAGDYCVHSGAVHRCIAAVTTAGAWDSSKWTEATLNDLVDDVNRAVGDVDNKLTKGDYDGTTGVGYADVADNLNATKGLTVNDDPMSFGIVGGAQKSAVGDGNASLNKLTCVGVVRNQHVIRFDTAIQRNQFKESYDGASGILTLTRNSNPAVDNFAGLGIIDAHVIKDHYYIALMDVKLTTSTSALYSITANPSYINFNSMRLANGEWMSYKSILRIPNKQTAAYFYTMLNDVKDLAQGDTLQYRNVRLIDLTQRYGNNDVVNAIIGSGTSDEQVERLLAFDPEILSDTAHDAGTLVPSKSAKLVSKDEDDNVLGTVTLPNYEGHGILKVVDGKVVADGDELYPDGNSKKRWREEVIGDSNITGLENFTNVAYARVRLSAGGTKSLYKDGWSSKYGLAIRAQGFDNASYVGNMVQNAIDDEWWFGFPVGTTLADMKSALVGTSVIEKLATEQDISTPVYQSTFPVEQGGTLQFLDENDKPIAGLQGSEIFYQKNIKAFVEALGEATDWNPERIKRLGSLSFTPEYVNIALSPSPTGAYARAQVYNATFTIVISAPLTGTANGSITFQDSEVDLFNFQTKPAESIYDMDGKKVSEEPKTADCNIASFVGRSKGGTIMWSLLHSGVNKVKIHIEEAVPLDSDGKGKIDCRASLIL